MKTLVLECLIFEVPVLFWKGKDENLSLNPSAGSVYLQNTYSNITDYSSDNNKLHGKCSECTAGLTTDCRTRFKIPGVFRINSHPLSIPFPQSGYIVNCCSKPDTFNGPHKHGLSFSFQMVHSLKKNRPMARVYRHFVVSVHKVVTFMSKTSCKEKLEYHNIEVKIKNKNILYY